MKAVILAAGEGKRLRPFTETMPKVMLPVANKPILEHVFDAVKKNGIEEAIVVVGYKKEVIMDYFKDYKGLKIIFIVQDKQLGTAHALLQSKHQIKEDFIAIPGDNIIDQKSISNLIKDKSDYSLLVKENPHPSKYGLVFIEKGRLKEIIEKPQEETGKFISTGIYKFPKNIFNIIKNLSSDGIYALSTIIQSIVEHGKKINTITADFWMDIVYPWDLIFVNESMISKSKFSVSGTIEKNVIFKGNVSVGKDTKIYSGCYIVGPVIIGEGCEIGPNTCIFPSTTIGNNAVIHPFSEIRNSVIMNDTHIGSNSFVKNSIIARGSIINNNFSTIPGETTIEVDKEFKKIQNLGAMIGEDCNIKSHVVVEPGIIIGRKCEIEAMKKINKNLKSNSKVM